MDAKHIKNEARRIKKSIEPRKIQHYVALDLAAQKFGYSSYRDFLNQTFICNKLNSHLNDRNL